MIENTLIFFYLVQIFAAVIGFFICWYIYHKKRFGEKLVCPIGSSCDAVVHSEFSKFLGFPIEIMGMLYYGLIAVGYAGFVCSPDLYRPEIFFVLFLLSMAGFIFSLYLTFIQLFTLRDFCSWCLTSAVLTSLIFILALYTIGAQSGGLFGFLELMRPGIMVVHVLAMALGLGSATVTDIFFFNFLKDFRISQKENEVLQKLSQVIWLALGIAFLSGLGLFLPQAELYLGSAKFLLKMIVFMVIVINGAVLNLFIAPLLTKISFGGAHKHHPGELIFGTKVAFALGAISFVSWYTAFVLGSVRSIPVDLIVGFEIYLGVLILAILASQIVERVFVRRGESYAQLHPNQEISDE